MSLNSFKIKEKGRYLGETGAFSCLCFAFAFELFILREKRLLESKKKKTPLQRSLLRTDVFFGLTQFTFESKLPPYLNATY